jgi:glutamate synthase (ferredoxin)
LRAKFAGTPEAIIHFFLHVAEEVREILASLGARTLDEVVGRTDLLRQVPRGHADADALDLSAMLERVDAGGAAIRNTQAWNGRVHTSELNTRLLAAARLALQHGEPVALSYPIGNRDRTVGATLSGAIATQYGEAGLPEGTITVRFAGSAGQSFGAFLAHGVRLLLEGEANDYVGKGMAGGEIVLRPPVAARYPAQTAAIVGNTVLYGATGGEFYAAGRAGERFAVRNSGALAVIEGVGDHGCEYMTGGVVLVIGPTGRNFGAGMTGGRAYVFDADGGFAQRCNQDLVELGPLEALDEQHVRTLLIRHLERTGSGRADELLLNWDKVRTQFWRVQPRGLAPASLPHPVLQLPARVEDAVSAA